MNKKEKNLQLHDNISKIQTDIGDIKLDLNVHIKRTDALEDMVKPLYNAKVGIQYCIGLLSLIGVIYTISQFI